MVVLKCPKRLNLSNAIEYGAKIASAPLDVDKIVFDFSALGYTPPFGLGFISLQIDALKGRKPEGLQLVATGHDRRQLGYAAHMGFFKSFGLDHGNEVGQASGSSTYVPLREVDLIKLKTQAHEYGEEFGERVVPIAEELSRVLCQRKDENLRHTLSYCILEMLRNCAEHSFATKAYCLAQYWPSKDLVEVAILDNGKGVLAALRKNPFVDLGCDRDAVKAALMPGISGKMYKGVKKQLENQWQNSGYGLFMTSQICSRSKCFFIASGASALQLTDRTKCYHDCQFSGTAIRMQLKPSRLELMSQSLAEFRDKGSRLAARFGGNKTHGASSMSQMLNADFLD